MAQDLDNLVDRLLDSYRQHGGINHLDGVNLPSKQAVARITTGLLRLLFPGFFDSNVLHSRELAAATRTHAAALRDDLRAEILKSLEFHPRAGDPADRLPETAASVACALLDGIPCVRELLVTDVEAAYDGDPAARSFEEIIVAYPFIEAIAVQRMAHVLHRLHVALIPRIMTEWAHSRTGIDIHPGAAIGPFFFIDHGTGVVIGETARIGRGVKLYQGVTLGAKSFKKDAAGRVIKGSVRHPAIEDDVTIYAGATILGGDTVIGARSTVAGNVWLTHSVPPDSLVFYEGERVVIHSKAARGAPNVPDFQI